MRTRRLTAYLLVAVTIFVWSSPAAFADDSSDADSESWVKIEIGGQPVGYEFSRQRTENLKTVTESTSLVRINRFGQSFEMKTVLNVVETNDKLTSFRLEQHTPGQPTQVSRGKRRGNEMEVTTTSNGRETTRSISIPSDVLSPTAVDRYLDEDPPEKGESVELKVFSVETLDTTTMILTGLGRTPTKWADGAMKPANTIQMTRGDMPLAPKFYLDDGGEVLKVDFGLMGMVGWSTTREDALAAAEGNNSIDLGERTVLKVAPRPGLSGSKTAVYRVSGTDLPGLPGSQEITTIGDETFVEVLTPDVNRATSAGDVDTKFLASTRWVDWKSNAVQKVAARVDADGSPGQLAASAEKVVSKAVSNKSFGVGFATASEVATTREGDCTEHGVLLAAVLRASGLPSRVAYGLVYVESMAAMVPHMWTEVALGDTWIPLDATRPGQPNGGYLKFGDSALDSDATLPIKDLLRLSQDLEKMEVVVVDEVPSIDQPAGAN